MHNLALSTFLITNTIYRRSQVREPLTEAYVTWAIYRLEERAFGTLKRDRKKESTTI